MTSEHLGRSRLTRNLLRELLRGLLLARPVPDGTNVVGLSEHIVTNSKVAGWLRAMGRVAADADLSPSDKITFISSALVSKLKEMELLECFDEAHDAQITVALKKIVTEDDADVQYAGLRDRVLHYVYGIVGIDSPEAHAGHLEGVLSGVEKTLTLLRFRGIEDGTAMSLLMYYLGVLAQRLGRDLPNAHALKPIDAHLWSLLSPYIDTPTEATSAQKQAPA